MSLGKLCYRFEGADSKGKAKTHLAEYKVSMGPKEAGENCCKNKTENDQRLYSEYNLYCKNLQENGILS